MVPSRGAARRGTRAGPLAGAAAALLGVVAIALAARALSAAAAPAPRPSSPSSRSLPCPVLAGEALASVPAARSSRRPGSSRGLATGPEAGRVFAPAGQDRTLALRWKYAEGAAWGEGPVRRAALALAGYTNLFHGVASASTASPIGDPRAERLVGAALAGGDAARILALLNVRHVLSPFPTSARGFRPGRRGAKASACTTCQDAFGRAFLPLEARVATDDEAFEALRDAGLRPRANRPRRAPSRGTRLPRPRLPGAGPPPASSPTSPSAPSSRRRPRPRPSSSSPEPGIPGWSARIDGAPVPLLRAHLALLAARRSRPASTASSSPTGPPPSGIGLGLSAAGLLGVLALALAGPPGGRGR